MPELIIKVRKVHSTVTESLLTRYLTLIGLRQAPCKSIEHAQAATNLLRKEAAQLVKELHRPTLPRLGCNRNFSLFLRHNPPFLLGLGLHDHYHE